MIRTRVALATVLPALLAACGGGGGGDPAAPTATITAQNAPGVVRHVLAAALGLVEVGDTAAGSVPALGQVASPLRTGLLALLVQQLDRMAAPTAASVLRDGSLPGPFGGRVEYLWNDRDADARLSTGDTIELLFDGYLDDSGVRLDGWLRWRELRVAGDPALQTTWTFAARVELGNLAVLRNGSTTQLVGTIDFDLQRRPTVAYTRLVVRQTVSAGEVVLLPGAVVEYGEYDAESTFLVAGDGLLTGDALGGFVAYATTTSTGGFVGEPNPSRGALAVRGGNGSLLQITIVDATTIRVELDADGDGEVDDTWTSDWASL